MNALHVESERKLVESVTVPRSQSKPIKSIATERISSISITRTGRAFYEVFTAVDIERFKRDYAAARFVWNDTLKTWNLFESVGDLLSCVVRIRRS